MELSGRPFYVATLFVPQMSSRPEKPHPLIVAYLRAALAFQTSRRNSEKEEASFEITFTIFAITLERNRLQMRI